MKKYSIEEVCRDLGISRQGLNARCRKLGIEKVKVGRRSYFSHRQYKQLKGGDVKETKKDDPDSAGEFSNNQILVERLINENDYLRKKLDEESNNLKGAMSVIIQHTERIKKLEVEKDKLLEWNGSSDIMENDGETKWKRKREQKDTKWYEKILKGFGPKI